MPRKTPLLAISILLAPFALNAEWLPLREQTVDFDAASKRIELKSTSPKGQWAGIYNADSTAGAFQIDATLIDNESTSGIAIFQVVDGQPDLENYTALVVDAEVDGHARVRVTDRVDGETDVWDVTGSMLSGYQYYEETDEAAHAAVAGRYQHKIERAYSMPFDSIDGRLKIVRDAKAGFFHFYYGYTTEIHGKTKSGWMELAPSKDWAPKGGDYVVGLLTKGDASFEAVQTSTLPWEDEAEQSGFTAQERPFTWSGNTGDAWVLTFDPERMVDSAKEAQFVFWSRANYIPTWKFSNQLLYTYEFIETWDEDPESGHHGCFEPMSDRLLRFSEVALIEDNAVRKVFKWRYALMNPDYNFPRMREGKEIPWVEEIYVFYPDATGVRHITYRPKLDSAHRMWHELAELIVIAGTTTNPKDHVASPAVSILNLEGELHNFLPHPQGSFNHRDYEPWNQIVSVAHFKSAPDAYLAFSQDDEIPQTFPQIPFGVDVSWHTTDDRMCHWPVGLEPYQGPDKSHANWKAQVAHTSLAGVGVFEGDRWDDRYQKDENGRSFRTWTAGFGLTDPKDTSGVKERVAAWIYPGQVKKVSGAKYKGYNYQLAEHQFELSKGDTIRFKLKASADGKGVRNPVLAISGATGAPSVSIDGKTLEPYRDFEYAIEGDRLLIWLNAQSDSELKIELNFKDA